MIHQHYYTKGKHKECILEMQDLTDIYTVCDFCLMNMYKYSYRAGLKTKNKETDLDKIVWYKEYAHNLIIQMSFFKRKKYLHKYRKICNVCTSLLNE